MTAITKTPTFAEQSKSLQKYTDTKGNTVTWSYQHKFWIVDDGKKFFTTACAQASIEKTHPVNTKLKVIFNNAW